MYCEMKIIDTCKRRRKYTRIHVYKYTAYSFSSAAPYQRKPAGEGRGGGR